MRPLGSRMRPLGTARAALTGFGIVGVILGATLLARCDAHAMEIEGWRLEAGVSPPHNEEVVDGLVARYRAGAGVVVRLSGPFRLEPSARMYGLQRWRPLAANGIAAFREADYGVDRWQGEYTVGLRMGDPDGVSLRYAHTVRPGAPTHEGRYFGWLMLEVAG